MSFGSFLGWSAGGGAAGFGVGLFFTGFGGTGFGLGAAALGATGFGFWTTGAGLATGFTGSGSTTDSSTGFSMTFGAGFSMSASGGTSLKGFGAGLAGAGFGFADLGRTDFVESETAGFCDVGDAGSPASSEGTASFEEGGGVYFCSSVVTGFSSIGTTLGAGGGGTGLS